MRDPYATLGVRRNAGLDEIKAAWRNAAKSAHPDHNQDDPDAAQRFAEIGRAYEVLKDPKLRNRYDQARREADLRRMEELKARMQAANAAAQAEAEKPIGPETAEEMVDRLFGEGKGRTGGPSPFSAQSQAQAQAQAQSQAQAQPQYQQQSQARPRSGTDERGFDARTDARTGDSEREDWAEGDDGERPAAQKGGFMLRRAAAPAAELVNALVKRLRGRIVEKTPDLVVDVPVTVTQLFRRERVSVSLPEGETVKIAVPAGAVDGQPIRLREQGYRVAGARRGDAVAILRFQRDERFRIEGLDLVTTISIDIQDAVLGCERQVESLDGAASIEVPAWSGSDKAVRIAGRGLMGSDGQRGDLVVELRIVLFEKPDEKITDLMRSMKHGLYL